MRSPFAFAAVSLSLALAACGGSTTAQSANSPSEIPCADNCGGDVDCEARCQPVRSPANGSLPDPNIPR